MNTFYKCKASLDIVHIEMKLIKFRFFFLFNSNSVSHQPNFKTVKSLSQILTCLQPDPDHLIVLVV